MNSEIDQEKSMNKEEREKSMNKEEREKR